MGAPRVGASSKDGWIHPSNQSEVSRVTVFSEGGERAARGEAKALDHATTMIRG